MTIISLLYLLSSNAATLRRDKSIWYARIAIAILVVNFSINYNSYYNEFLENQIALFSGLYQVTVNTHVFHMFVFILSAIILQLNGFYPRRVHFEQLIPLFNPLKLLFKNNFILNKMSEQFRIIEYPLVILFIITGGTFLISSSDLISVFLSIELQSYGLYILCAVYRNSERAMSGALMYFLLGGLSSCFILLSSGLLYGNSGNTTFEGLYIVNDISSSVFYSIYSNHFVKVSLIILAVGLLFKISAAPFHFWSPDVYDAVPTVVTTFIAVFTKVPLLILLLVLASNTNKYIGANVTETYFSYVANNSWVFVILVSSFLSLIVGSILGLTQSRIKRLYAYSTISHLGFILLALAINSIESIQAFVFYLMQYSVTNLNSFLLLITIGCSLYMYVEKTTDDGAFLDKKNSPLQLVNQLKGYFYVNPVLSLSLTITLFSFVGVPPLAGFFGKLMVLSSSLDNGYVFMSLVAILTSAISAYYYLAIVKKMFFEKSNYYINPKLIKTEMVASLNTKNLSLGPDNIKLSGSLTISVSILTLLLIFFISFSEQLLNIISTFSV